MAPHHPPPRTAAQFLFSPELETGLTGLAYSTTADRRVSLNNITVSLSPIFDDDSLVSFGIENFLDPNFKILGPIRSYAAKNLGCLAPRFQNQAMEVTSSGDHQLNEVSDELRTKGCSIMASFIEMQFHGVFFKYQTLMVTTVFALFDQVLVNQIGNLSEHSSIFHRHVLGQ